MNYFVSQYSFFLKLREKICLGNFYFFSYEDSAFNFSYLIFEKVYSEFKLNLKFLINPYCY